MKRLLVGMRATLVRAGDGGREPLPQPLLGEDVAFRAQLTAERVAQVLARLGVGDEAAEDRLGGLRLGEAGEVEGPLVVLAGAVGAPGFVAVEALLRAGQFARDVEGL